MDHPHHPLTLTPPTPPLVPLISRAKSVFWSSVSFLVPVFMCNRFVENQNSGAKDSAAHLSALLGLVSLFCC